MIRLLAILAAGLTVGCNSADPTSDDSCGPGGRQCLPQFECSPTTHTCVPTGTKGIDAGTPDAPPPDAAPPQPVPDAAPPDATSITTTRITEKPPARTNETTATFRFASTSSAPSFMCATDQRPADPCSPPYLLSGLHDGRHHFEVRAVEDLAGESYDWEIDTTAPTAVLRDGPELTGSDGRFTYDVATAEAGARFECSLDSAAFAACAASGYAFTDLADGTHTFRVRALDDLGNVGAPVSATFVVNTTGPTVAMLAPAAGATTGLAVVLSYAIADADVAATSCTLDGAPLATCASGSELALAPGSHTLTVSAMDLAGNEGPVASTTFTVAPPPAVQVASPRAGATTDRSVTVRVASDGAVSLTCKLDGRTLAACPLTGVSLTSLAAGSHTFVVTGVNEFGDAGPPAQVTWTVAWCGDGVVRDGVEACDGANLGGATCADLGFPGGTLSCDGSCQLSDAACARYPAAAGDLVVSELVRHPLLQMCVYEDFDVTCPATCFDRTCDPGETCSNCPYDCGDCPVGSGEWIELYNATAHPLQLEGLAVSVAAQSFTVGSPVVVAAHGYAVLGNGDGGSPSDYDYGPSGVAMPEDGAFAIAVASRDAAPIDGISVPAPDLTDYYHEGRSLALGAGALDADANDAADAWCRGADDDRFEGPNYYHFAAHGTPGAPNDVCRKLTIDLDRGSGALAVVQTDYYPSNVRFDNACGLRPGDPTQTQCSRQVAGGQMVHLTPLQYEGVLEGWSGSCLPDEQEPGYDPDYPPACDWDCYVTMDQAREVSMKLATAPTLSISFSGPHASYGRVTSISSPPPACEQEIDCSDACSMSRTAGTDITLQVDPYGFCWGVSGCDSLVGHDCHLTMGSADRSVVIYIGNLVPDPETGSCL